MSSDPKEIEKFAQLARDWWDLNGPLKTLHHINPLRLTYIQQHAPLSGQHVLDVGCGGGILSESLWQQGALVHAIDLDAEGIAAAKAHQQISHSKVQYEVMDLLDLAKKAPSSYDVITCMELLEHVPQPEQLLQACASLLKPKGYLFLSTLNRTLKAYLFAIVGAEYVMNLLPRGTHHYEKFITPSELIRACEKSDFSCINLKGMSYNPFSKKVALTSDCQINYLACFQKND